MNHVEAMKQALEALDNLARYADTCELFLKETHPGKADALRERVTNSIEAITSLRQAIEQAEKQEPVAWNSGVPPLYPEIKDGETISVKYIEATTPAAYPEFECPRCGHCCSHSSIVSGS